MANEDAGHGRSRHAIGTGSLEDVSSEGDTSLVATLLALLDRVDPQFPIVTP